MATQVNISRLDFKAFYPVSTRWKDNDIYGHVNNVNYYAFFDTVANSFLIHHCGLDIHQGELIALVVSSSCEYLSPIAFPDKIDVGLRIDNLGNSSVQYSLAVFKQGDEQACAFGSFIHVFVDRASRRPKRIPDTMRKHMLKITARLDG